MHLQGNTAIRSNLAPRTVEASLGETMVDQHRTGFGAVDTRALAFNILGVAQQDASAGGRLLNQMNAALSPVEQGNLQRDLSDIVKAIVDAIAKFFGSMFAAPTAAPSAPATGSPASTPATATPAPAPAAAPPAAASASQVPNAAAIARDPVVARAIETAWNASNPNTPGAKVETGFWVVRDDRSGALSVVQFPSNGTRDSLTPGAPPRIDGKTTVAFFHTHPNTAAEGYISGPSAADQRFADRVGVPGIIRSHDGMIYFNPR